MWSSLSAIEEGNHVEYRQRAPVQTGKSPMKYINEVSILNVKHVRGE